jgi:heptosyltransferase I
MRVLLVKMSSLGDVVHALTGVTDAVRAIPGITFDWVVEEAYATIPAWHPAVRRVITCAIRRWRKSPVATFRGGHWSRFRQELQQEEYDLVLDAQGLIKSGIVARQARGPIAGRTAKTAREATAALFYKHSHGIDLALTEVEQLRQLFALSLNYKYPNTPADFGIARDRLPSSPNREPHAVLLHGAAWKAKLWPEKKWVTLARFLRDRGLKPVMPWGTSDEYQRAVRIAEASGGEVLPKLGIDELAAMLGQARLAIGLDTGLTHIAIALGVRTVTLYGPSVPVYQEVAGGTLVNLCSTDAAEVDTRRANTVPLEQVVEAVRPWSS